MCGIAGIYAYEPGAPPVSRPELHRISEHMARRGPDGEGLWMSAQGGAALAHRRLSIIDVSEAGAQPMASADGRYVITFNGEIYNHRPLRADLESQGAVFRSGSDTEVLLHLYARLGAGMNDLLRGMYAMAIWDQQARTLFLARDPFGIKPLYYADDGKTLRFASQVKALLAGGAIDTAPEPAGSVGFLLMGSVPEPYTLYRNIRSLPAGSTLTVRPGRAEAPHVYFDLRETLLQAQDAAVDPAQAQATLAEAVHDAVRAHLVADVPVGLFLSAGIDSAVIAAVAREVSASELHAVTLGFGEFSGTPQDEVPLARNLASSLGLRHHAQLTSRADFDRLLPDILHVMDQPSIDGVNTYLVSGAAAQAGLKVVLSGLGGDELLGGYPSFKDIPRWVERLRWTRHCKAPARLARALASRWVQRFTSPKAAGMFEYGGSYGGAYLLRRGVFMPWELKELLDPATVHAGLERLDLVNRLERCVDGVRNPHARVSALELGWYMRNQLLRDADWAGMAHSLEIRVPLVDVRLFKAMAPFIAGRHPPTKSALISVPRKPLPQALAARPKTGFATPVRQWIAGEQGLPSPALRDWARHVLPRQPRLFRAFAMVTEAYGGRGGIAKFNRDLLDATAALPDCAEVVVLPRLPCADPPRPPRGVTLNQRATATKWGFLKVIVRAMALGPCDLVIIGHINYAFVGRLAAGFLRAPTVLVVHGIDAWTPHDSIWVRSSLGAMHRVFGVSRYTLHRLAAWSGIPAQRQRLLPNCIDLDQFTPGDKPADLVAKYGLEHSKVLMTFGRLASEERYKGVDEVLAALPALLRHDPAIRYLVCGEGTDRARLQAKADDMGLADQVVFTGFVGEDRKIDHYRLADGYVMPGRGEGFGIVYLEALACGIPVLGSSVDGSREALLEGALGELADPGDPADVLAGIRRTLDRGRGQVMPQLAATFSVGAFRHRAGELIYDALERNEWSTQVGDGLVRDDARDIDDMRSGAAGVVPQPHNTTT